MSSTHATFPTIAEAGPVHDQREIDAVVRVLQAPGRLAIGPEVAEFERRGAELLAKQHAVMVNSGTSALWLAVDLLGCEPGDEVITSPLTFSSDIAPLVRNGIVPAFVDVDPETLQIDVDGIEAMIGPRTKAILTPNLVGNCPDWDAIRAIADRHGLLVVEDSCDVLDSYLRGTRTGTRSDISVTSFARGHSITAASNGGMIAVDDPEWFDQSLVRRRWGRHSERYLFGSKQGDDDRFGTLADGTPYDMVFLFEDTGYNFEPSEIGAAYGNVQLERLLEFNEHGDSRTSPASTRCSRSTRTRVGARAHHPRRRDHVDALPVPAARGHRPHRDAGVPARAGDPVAHGVDRQHPAPARVRRHHPPSPERRPAERRPRDGPRAHAAVAPRAEQRRGGPHRGVARRAILQSGG